MPKDERSVGATAKQDRVDPETPPTTHAFSFSQQSTVTLLVGPDEQPLIAHESYITLNSEFFKAAMKKQWSEGQKRVIKLPEVGVEAVENYLTFTYGRGLPTATIKVVPKTNPEVGPWNLLIELYIFGERVLDTCIRNEVVKELVRISELVHCNRNTLMCSASHVCFDGTLESSPIRRLLVDEFVASGTEEWLASPHGAHPEFLLQLSKELLQKVSRRQTYAFRGRHLNAEDYFV
jgi:hypothetical protein